MKEFIAYFKSKMFLRTVIGMVIILIILSFILSRWLSATTRHDEKIPVPNLDKLTFSEVENILNNLSLEAVVLDSSSFDPNYPKFSVTGQNPMAGDSVKMHRKIYLTINPSGFGLVTIPRIFGKTLRQAEIELKNLGLRIGNSPSYIPDKGKDVVRGIKLGDRSLSEGSKIKKNTLINFILGSGNDEPIDSTYIDSIGIDDGN
ncbi:MAG: serine/threonine protein kinase [Flavobacteriales bacterium CG_4_8_14_3_um_filter_35_10]|nr:MAG: serine/threonine protein kinase [Flavobacteriales bacterium CG_4_8_14_3_um_filter_35_10]